MSNIYESIFATPNNTRAIDAKVDNLFTWQIVAKTGVSIKKYKLVIEKNSDNSIIYNPTITLTSDNYLYDSDTLSHNTVANSLVNGEEYKHYVEVFENIADTEGIKSGEIIFKTNSAPSISLNISSTITAQKLIITPTYTQSENVPIESFQYFIYDESDNILHSNDHLLKYGGKLTEEFTGLDNGNTYKIEFKGTTINGVEFTSGKQSFTVSYAKPNVTAKPSISQDTNTSLITVGLSPIIQETGIASGTYTWEDNFIQTGNTGIHIDTNSYVEFPVDIPEDGTTIIDSRLINLSSNKAVELINTDTGDIYEVGHDGSSFYWKQGDYHAIGRPRVLPTVAFQLIILPTQVIVKVDDDMEIIKI